MLLYLHAKFQFNACDWQLPVFESSLTVHLQLKYNPESMSIDAYNYTIIIYTLMFFFEVSQLLVVVNDRFFLCE